VKFSEFGKATAVRRYDDLIGTFTRPGHVDEESQRNDLAIVKLVAEGNELVPPHAAMISASRDKRNSSLTNRDGSRSARREREMFPV
jgi:hypothetical protein